MADEPTVIGPASSIRGNVRGTGTLEVYGRIEGDVHIDGDVHVAETGGVRGNIIAARIVVAGQIAGDLTGSDMIQLEPGAKVAGDSSAPSIGIADGALVRGRVQTEGAGRVPAPVQRARPEPARSEEPKAKPAPSRPAPKKAEPTRSPSKTASTKPAKKATKKKVRKKAPAPVVPAAGRRSRAKKKKARR